MIDHITPESNHTPPLHLHMEKAHHKYEIHRQRRLIERPEHSPSSTPTSESSSSSFTLTYKKSVPCSTLHNKAIKTNSSQQKDNSVCTIPFPCKHIYRLSCGNASKRPSFRPIYFKNQEKKSTLSQHPTPFFLRPNSTTFSTETATNSSQLNSTNF